MQSTIVLPILVMLLTLVIAVASTWGFYYVRRTNPISAPTQGRDPVIMVMLIIGAFGLGLFIAVLLGGVRLPF